MVAPEEERFLENIKCLIQLVAYLTQQARDKGCTIVGKDMIDIASHFITALDKHYLLKTFVFYSHKSWDKIKIRNRDFFTKEGEADNIFKNLPVEGVYAFRTLFTTLDKNGKPIITDGDVEDIWDGFGSLVKISIKYINKNPEIFKECGIDVNAEAKKWEINFG